MNIRHDIDYMEVMNSVHRKIASYEEQLATTIKSFTGYIKEGSARKSEFFDINDSEEVKIEKYTKGITKIYQKFINQELNYYSTVRVIQLPHPPLWIDRTSELYDPNKVFILVYGDILDSEVERGTGPTISYEDSKAWFINQGR